MMQVLSPQELTVAQRRKGRAFDSTLDLLAQAGSQPSGSQLTDYGWKLQPEAKQTLMLGLSIPQSACNVLVLGTPGSGRRALSLAAMRESSVASIHPTLSDWVALFDISQQAIAHFVKLPVGLGAQLRTEMDGFIKALVGEMPTWVDLTTGQVDTETARAWCEEKVEALRNQISSPKLSSYFNAIGHEVVSFLSAWQQATSTDTEHTLDGLIHDGFLSRFRVNLLVDHRTSLQLNLKQAVCEEKDPSFSTLFGSMEPNASESSLPEFMRLRAGSLQQADGGMLLLHLRDFMQDETNGSAMLEKLYRFTRNGELAFEDWSNVSQSGGTTVRNGSVPLQVKLVMIASREDYYDCLEAHPDFFEHFPIKVEFEDRVPANLEHDAWFAGYIAKKCQQNLLPHFTESAVYVLLKALHRLEEDQMRMSTNFAFLEQLMHESIAMAKGAELVDDAHVKSALAARLSRQQFFETQIRDSIIDNELMIQVHGSVVGQVNGLTHIELGDASFGSPIRITARCYPGQKGLINIDREVKMSGPNHDKGIYILQNWLSASFWALAPLSLNASLVFEQEYNGVEGDSASCAELFALLSALSGLPVMQGIAVTGALNQFGEVMPIGGVNEKIEGYFRVCQDLGLNGEQGVIIPKRNQRHLVLNDEVVQAVKDGQFKIIAIDHVLEGIAYLTGRETGIKNQDGFYSAGTVMGESQAVLARYRQTLERNQTRILGESSTNSTNA